MSRPVYRAIRDSSHFCPDCALLDAEELAREALARAARTGHPAHAAIAGAASAHFHELRRGLGIPASEWPSGSDIPDELVSRGETP